MCMCMCDWHHLHCDILGCCQSHRWIGWSSWASRERTERTARAVRPAGGAHLQKHVETVWRQRAAFGRRAGAVQADARVGRVLRVAFVAALHHCGARAARWRALQRSGVHWRSGGASPEHSRSVAHASLCVSGAAVAGRASSRTHGAHTSHSQRSNQSENSRFKNGVLFGRQVW